MAEKVFIDLDEEIIFAVEKVKKVAGDKVIIIVPERANIIGSTVSLRLLAMGIAQSDKTGILVTTDEIGRKLAEKSDFLVVSKVGEIDNETWKEAASLKRKLLTRSTDRKESLLNERHEKMGGPAPIKETHKAPPQAKRIDPLKTSIGGFEMISGGDIAQFTSKKPATDTNIHKEKGDNVGSKEGTSRQEMPSRLVGKDFSRASFVDYKEERANQEDKSGAKKGLDLSAAWIKVKGVLAQGGKNKFIIAGVIIVLLFGGFSYFILPSGTVAVTVESQDITIEKDVVADTASTALDIENLTIPAETLEVNRDRSDSADTTGTKETGEKATGQVTLINTTDNPVTIAAGTVIECINTGLKYTTNVSATIEAKLPEEQGGTLGMEEVGITAQSFGEQYNIQTVETFKITGFDADKVYAKNFSSMKITGGTTEQKKVVSQEDYDKLKKTLEDSLKQDLLDALHQEVKDTKQLLEDTIKYETVSEEATPAIDAEATNFTLSMSMKATALSFEKSNLDSLAEALVTQENGSSVEVEEFDYESSVTSTEGNKINIKLTITGVVTPTIDLNNLKSSLSGKSKSFAQEYLSSRSDIKSFTIHLGPSWLPSFLQHFPSADKIKVEVSKVQQGD